MVDAEFTYEVEALIENEGGIAMCDESEADYWGVYERPVEPDEHGNCLAVLIADFARKEDAQAFRDLMEKENKHTAVPAPKKFGALLASHLGEVMAMLETLHFEHPKFGTSAGGDFTIFTLIHEMADELKAGRIKVQVVNRKAIRNSLTGQIVSAADMLLELKGGKCK